MTTRLVSFLGLGPLNSPPPHYTPVWYEMNGRKSSEKSPLAHVALIELVPDISCVFVLGTEDVRKRWLDTGLFAEHINKPFQFVDPPLGIGNTELERWAMFTAMTAALSLDPLCELGETASPDTIIVDITHGFRLQPMLGLAALSFTLSEWSRQGVPKLPAIRIVYGAFEASKDGIAPIWDLTEFVTASRWDSAIEALMRYGRADDFEQMARLDSGLAVEEARRIGLTGKELGEAGYAKFIGVEAKRFADDLATARLKSVLTESSVRLHRALCDERTEALVRRLPPIRKSLEKLRDWVEPLKAQSTFTREGLRATAYLAQLLGRLERYAEQAAVLREGLVTLYAVDCGQEPLREPGTGFPLQKREELDRSWGEAGRSFRDGKPDWPEVIRRNVELSQHVVEARNDIEHCGINDRPSSAETLRARLQEFSTKFSQLVGGKAP